jgi:hypothetical protein
MMIITKFASDKRLLLPIKLLHGDCFSRRKILKYAGIDVSAVALLSTAAFAIEK